MFVCFVSEHEISLESSSSTFDISQRSDIGPSTHCANDCDPILSLSKHSWWKDNMTQAPIQA
jgi:hypothetical protein